VVVWSVGPPNPRRALPAAHPAADVPRGKVADVIGVEVPDEHLVHEVVWDLEDVGVHHDRAGGRLVVVRVRHVDARMTLPNAWAAMEASVSRRASQRLDFGSRHKCTEVCR
jgi:hypothetical protein